MLPEPESVAGGAPQPLKFRRGLIFSLELVARSHPPSEPTDPSLFTSNSTLLHLNYRFLLATASDPMPIALLNPTINHNLDRFS